MGGLVVAASGSEDEDGHGAVGEDGLSQTPSGQVVVGGGGREESADLRSMRMGGLRRGRVPGGETLRDSSFEEFLIGCNEEDLVR